MRILKRIGTLQAVAEKLRRSGMIIDMVSMFYQPRRGVMGLAHIMPSVSTSSTLRFQDWERVGDNSRIISSLRDLIYQSSPNGCSETRRDISSRSRARGQSSSDREIGRAHV